MRLIQRKQIWVLTAQGWFFTLGIVIFSLFFIVTNIHNFLSPNSPIEADILVVEGWMPDYALKSAIGEFEKGGYQKIMTTGLPVEVGFYLAQYKTFAELSAATLLEMGLAPDKVVAVPGTSTFLENVLVPRLKHYANG